MMKTNKKFVLISLFVVILLPVLMSMLFDSHQSFSANDEKSNKLLLKNLTEINKQLDDIAINIKNKDAQEQIKSMQDDINAAKTLLSDNAKAIDIKKVEEKIDLAKADIVDKIIQAEKSLLENSGAKQYLDPQSLPFKVVAIDIVGNQPYVSVNYDNHVTPLGVTDSLAGWRLLQADFDSNMAEFVNAKNQFIKINLHG